MKFQVLLYVMFSSLRRRLEGRNLPDTGKKARGLHFGRLGQQGKAKDPKTILNLICAYVSISGMVVYVYLVSRRQIFSDWEYL